MTGSPSRLPNKIAEDVTTLWDYHNLHHDLRRCDVGIGLGSHDFGVATYTAELYHRSLFPLIVFTGANSPTTIERCPRGEAVHYREHALELGVPDSAILVEPEATSTVANIELTRQLLADKGIPVRSVMLITRPYHQRRAHATCKKLWPEIDVVCAARPQTLAEHMDSIGDVDHVINMLVGETQRVIEYPRRGVAIPQDVPESVRIAYERLVAAGYTRRLIRSI